MKFYSNKFFISFLILTVIFYSLSIRTAQAGGDFLGDFFGGIVNILDTVFNVILNTVIGSIELFVGGVLGVDWLSADGSCRLGNVSGKVIKTYADECGGDSGGGGGGASGSPTLQNQTATPIINSDKTGTCTTGFTLNYETIDALRYGIYRDDNLLSQGFLGEERVTQCFVYSDDNPPSDCYAQEEPFYDEDGKPYYRYAYNEDGSIASKKGNIKYYKKEYYSWPSPHTSNFSYTDSGLAPNKDYKYDLILLDKNGTQYRYPQLNAYSECIKLDLKVNGGDEPDTVKVASNYVTLNWITEGALSCLASGDWSGSKGPATGREELGKIARGTSNPGLGKTYNYSMTCQYPKNKTLTDSGSVTVFKYPECNFSADPAVIEVLPATSTLSWDCRYYGGTPNEGSDSCSINQGIGSVSPLNDSVSVRPSQETTYTLTCSTVDKTSDYQASVKIGFRPRVYEINPGAW
jgi:hypothetical protein